LDEKDDAWLGRSRKAKATEYFDSLASWMEHVTEKNFYRLVSLRDDLPGLS